MQHSFYGKFSKLYINPSISYISKFLNTNIKTLFTFPKTIWYSLRYNSGEKFLLTNTELYPYKYDVVLNEEQKNEPIRLSTSLYVGIKEIQAMQNSSESTTAIEKNKEDVLRNFNSLYYINSINKESDMPVAVYARILYAYVLISNLKLGAKTDKEVLRNIYDKFLLKIEFADAESISHVLFYLSFIKDYKSDWELLLNELNNKNFYPEFTKVSTNDPFIFRYQEIFDSHLKKKILSEEDNDLYILGMRSVYDSYIASKSVGDKLDFSEAIKNFEQRFPNLLENKYKIKY